MIFYREGIVNFFCPPPLSKKVEPLSLIIMSRKKWFHPLKWHRLPKKKKGFGKRCHFSQSGTILVPPLAPFLLHPWHYFGTTFKGGAVFA